jgi:hypothetical protein
MENSQFFPDGFSAAIVAAGSRARLETLKAGIAVFYRDWERNLDVMEQPDGRKFEVCFIAGAPRESNYRVIRELDRTAAWYVPVLTVFAGPNGSGKSSLIRQVEFEGRENLLEPDAIARRINPELPKLAGISDGREVLLRSAG